MIDLLFGWIALGLYALGMMLACALVRVCPAKTVVAVCALTTARKTAAISVDAIAVDSIRLRRPDTGGWRQGVRLAGPAGGREPRRAVAPWTRVRARAVAAERTLPAGSGSSNREAKRL